VGARFARTKKLIHSDSLGNVAKNHQGERPGARQSTGFPRRKKTALARKSRRAMLSWLGPERLNRLPVARRGPPHAAAAYLHRRHRRRDRRPKEVSYLLSGLRPPRRLLRGKIVMSIWRMIDAVLAAAASVPF
jgi:hypothetical protein